VGIDIGKSKADYALLFPDGKAVTRHQSYANSLNGYVQAKQVLLQELQRHGFEGLDIAVEATSYYWLPLYIQFSSDPDLARYHPRLALLNAGWVKWYKKSFPPDHKSDQRDPLYIGDRLRTLSDPIWWKFDAHWLSLRVLTRLRFHLTQSLVREKNYYQLFLFVAHSSFTLVKPFSDPFGVLSQSLLNDPELFEELSELPIDALAEQLHQLSHHHLRDPHETATHLHQAFEESYPLPADLDAAVRTTLTSLHTVIQSLQEQIRLLDQEISSLAQQNYPEVALLDSIPGLGLVFASGIAAEIGSLERFSSPSHWDDRRKLYRARSSQEVEDAVAKFAGLWWPENSSGQFAAEDRPLSKRGNAYLRYYILQAADRMRLSIPSYKSYYEKKYSQATKHHYKRALVLTGRKALGLFVGLLRHREPYRSKEAW
jgi:hypothetical protein